MKELTQHTFDALACRKELDDFKNQLLSKPTLDEAKDVLPFFKKRPNVTMLISTYSPALQSTDVYANEYPIYGSFRADAIVGDSAKHEYLVIEFENGEPDGIFRKVGKKSTREYSNRLEHAFSQIVDWLYMLNDMRSTSDFADVFGNRNAKFHGLVIIGKGVAFGKKERSRLAWRMDRILIDSGKISYVTFEQLYADLDFWLKKYHHQ